MATDIEARDQLSHDVGDYFKSATTSNAADGGEIIDTRLSEEADKTFVTDRTWIWIEGGQTSGPASNEERRTVFPDGLVTSTLSVLRDFSVTVPLTINYYIHRLFSAADKDESITQALSLVLPHLWKRVTQDITIVADQFDYDLSASSFYHGWPHQVHRVSPNDTEVTWPLYHWEMRGDNLHLFSRIPTGDTIKAIGITAPALTDISGTDLLILSSRAAAYLFETGLSSAPAELRTFFQQSLDAHRTAFLERVRQHSKHAEMGKTIRMTGHEAGVSDISFLRA